MAGLVLPGAVFFLMEIFSVPFAHGGHETVIYATPAMGLVEFGRFGTMLADGWKPELDRLAGYPAFLAVHFLMAGGKESYGAVAITQWLLSGGVVLLTGLSARLIRPGWFWPAILLAAVTPSVTYWSSFALPDMLFSFLVTATLYGFLKSLRGGHVLTGLAIALIAGSAAFATRPAFLLVPLAVVPVLFWALRRERKLSWTGSLASALALPALCLLLLLAQIAWVQSQTGHRLMTTQRGHHSLFYLYPCLAKSFGCGSPNKDALRHARTLFNARIAALPPEEAKNPAVRSKEAGALAMDLISDLPPLQIATATIGSYVRMLMNTSLVPIMERFEISRTFHVPEGQSPPGFLERMIALPQMQIWAIAQILVLAIRALQLYGCAGTLWSGLKSRRGGSEKHDRTSAYLADWFMPGLILLAFFLALLAPTAGIGNIRYRAPMEPVFILMTLQGVGLALCFFRKNKQPR